MKKLMWGSLLKLLLAVMLTFSLFTPNISFAQSTSVKPSEKNKAIESYVIDEIAENKEGFIENIGYKYVNAISESIVEENKISTKISAVEDYYDLDRNYLKTVIKSEEFINDLETGKALEKIQKKEVKLLPENFTLNHSVGTINLTNHEQGQVENLVNNQVKQFPDVEYTEAVGFTKEKLNEIKKVAAEAIEYYQENPQAVSSVERRGAYDNFYNVNGSTGQFHLQALSSSKNKYLAYTGTQSGSTKNATSVLTFKNNINGYEDYILYRMENSRFREVASWWGNIAGLVALVAGYEPGPLGWRKIVVQYGGAFSLFIGITSQSYATAARMDFSRVAAANLESARSMLGSGALYFENVNVTLVNGY